MIAKHSKDKSLSTELSAMGDRILMKGFCWPKMSVVNPPQPQLFTAESISHGS